jgi:hypothetical protein
MDSLHVLLPRIGTMNLRWCACVLECGCPLPLWKTSSLRKRQRTAALQDLAEFGRFMGSVRIVEKIT